MKQKVNIVELTAAFNTCRMQNVGKEFTNREIVELLHSLGFHNNIAAALAGRHFHTYREGKSKKYMFCKDPLHKSAIEALYDENRKYQKEYRSAKSPEEAAIELLKEQGYKLHRVVRFDETRFAKENPELYKQYLIFEEV